MMFKYRWCTAAGLALLSAGCSPDRQTAPPAEEEAPALARQGERQHLIELRGERSKDFDDRVKALGGRIKRHHRDVGIVSVTGLTETAAAQLETRTDVATVAPDKRVQWVPRREEFRLEFKTLGHRPARTPGTDQSDAFFYDFWQWNIRQIKADQAWGRTTGGRGATVCVLDTGVDPTHIDLAGKVNLAISTSTVAHEPTISDFHFHGTFVSSLISSNGLGMASVAPDATMCAVKVLDQTGFGTTDDIIAGIIHAANHGADVINMSLGAYVDTRDPQVKKENRVFQKAIDYATRKRVLVVASSGNDAINLDQDPRFMLHVPSQLDNVLSVGATAPINQRNFDLLASYSNFGRSGNDVVAPGGDLLSDDQDLRDLIFSACSSFVPGCEGGVWYAIAAGTSFAAPHVAGQAAVLEALFRGNQSAGSQTDCIEETADNVGSSRFFGEGRINVLRSARCNRDD